MANPLDGYDYTADIFSGTPLLVVDHQGNTWKLARKGVRYHEDVRSALHGAVPAKAPPAYAASQRLRTLVERTLREGQHEPGSRGVTGPGVSCPDGERIRWTDQKPGSYARRPELEIGTDFVRAVRPNCDDSPSVAWLRLTAAEMRRVRKDMEVANVGVHLPVVQIRERKIRVPGTHPLAGLVAGIVGASALNVTYVTVTVPKGTNYHEAMSAAALLYGGAVCGNAIAVPEPGSNWDVPVTAWRSLLASQGE